MPQSFLFFLIFIFGLIVGSFLNCIIYRLETEKSFLRGRSFCPFCKHQLGFFDLIPVLSFFFLGRKCRYCQSPISWQYPLVELATGILFSLIFYYVGHSMLYALYGFVIASFLIVIFVYDLKHYIIPDKVIYPAIGLAFLYRLFGIWDFGHWDLFRISDLGFGILPPLFLLAIILFSRGKWMGLGDFKLAILMGLFLGFPGILVALFLAFLIGAVFGVSLIIAGRKRLSSEIPFGPFLVTGTFIAFFWADFLVSWYQNLILLK
jgi:leader peptidase (prepilin peptidase)/N-methyltransferase